MFQSLLLHRYQLQEERAGAEDADEPQQEELGGRSDLERLQQSLQVRIILKWRSASNFLLFFSLNQQTVGEMLQLAKNYDKALEEEEKMTPSQLAIKNVGKLDPKRHLEEKVDVLMTNNVVQLLGAMLDTIVFK